MSEMNNTLDGVNDRSETAEEKISDLDSTAIETTQKEIQTVEQRAES